MSKGNISDELIIQTAANLSNEYGLDKLSLKLISKELNIKAPSLYNYIASLDEVKRRLMIYGWRQLQENVINSAIGVSGYDALKAMCMAFYEYATTNKGVFSAMLWYKMYQSNENDAATKKMLELLHKVLSPMKISDTNIDHIVRTLRSFLEGYSLLVNNDAFAFNISIKESFEVSLDIIINGIRDLEGVE